MSGQWKTLLLGDPLHNAEAQHQRLSNPVALAVFSSDALSSVAYATEEILLMLVLAGSAALSLAMPVAVAIGILLIIVATSYRQTIKAYPGGGGAYIVAKENLGTNVGLVAGAPRTSCPARTSSSPRSSLRANVRTGRSVDDCCTCCSTG